MKNGKYSNKNRKRRLRWNKQFVLLVSMVALLIGVIGGSLAYLFTNTDPVTNTFIPGEVDIDIDEPGWDHAVKRSVTIQNNGNVSSYIRAAVVVTWQDESGKVYPGMPAAGTDYYIDWETTGWIGPDNAGFYTFTTPVAPNGKTSVLITECYPYDDKTPENYHLVVDVISEAIQADGMDGNVPVVTSAWGAVLGGEDGKTIVSIGTASTGE